MTPRPIQTLPPAVHGKRRSFAVGARYLMARIGLAGTLILAMLLSLAGCRQHRPGPAAVPAAAAVSEPIVGSWSAERPIDLVPIIDQSGSMTCGGQPTDPSGRRLSATGALIDFLAGRSDTAQPDRFGLVNFGTDAPASFAIPLTPVTDADTRTLSRLRERIRSYDLGETNFIAGFQRALQLFLDTGPLSDARSRAVLLFTDGVASDRRHLTMAAYFSEIAEFVGRELRPRGIEVFVIGIDGGGGRLWSASAPSWRRIVGDDHVLTASGMGDLKEQYHNILLRLWHVPQADPLSVDPSRPTTFDVAPYLESLTIYAFPNRPHAALRLFRPDGRPVVPGKDPDVPPVLTRRDFVRLVVREPAPGMWSLMADGARIEVLRNPLPLRMRLISPGRIHPVGKPLRLVAEFRRADGRPVQSDRDWPLGLSAEVALPDGRHIPLKFPIENGHGGIYTADREIASSLEPGDCEITLKVSGGGAYQSQYPIKVMMQSIPYLEVPLPARGTPMPPADGIEVYARLMRAGRPVRAREAFSNHPDMLALAQVSRADKEVRGPAVWMSAVEEQNGTAFRASVPSPLSAEGGYTLSVRLAPEEKAMQLAADRSVLEVMMLTPPSPLWKRFLLPGVLLAILVVTGWLILARWRRARLRLPLYFWADDRVTGEILLFTQPNEARAVTGLPLRAVRPGRGRTVRLEPLADATLVRPDGTPLPAFDLHGDELIHVRAAGGTTRSVAFSYRAGLACPRPDMADRDITDEDLPERELPRPTDSAHETAWDVN